MNVEIIKIDQSFSLKTREVENYLVLRLPSGAEVKALVSDDDCSQIIQHSVGDGQETKEDDYAQDNASVDVMGFEGVQPVLEAPPAPINAVSSHQLVEWRSLNVGILPDNVREVLESSSLPDRVELSKLLPLIRDISNQLNPPSPPPGPAQAPGFLQSAPRLQVPKDEMGNPIVPGGRVEQDPGEVTDEDGVPQL